MSNPTNSKNDRLAPLRAGVAVTLALTAAFVAGLPEDSQQPIAVEADESSGDYSSSGVFVLTGSVQIDQGTLRIEADSVTVTNQGGRIVRLVAEGQPARFRQHLAADEPFVNARARRIDYAVAEERLEMKGDAFLSQNDRELSSETIFWDIKEGRVVSRGSVKLKWQPEQPAQTPSRP